MLVNAGIIVSTRGVNGGYRLAKSASEISLLDICEAVEGPMTGPRVEMDGFAPASCKLLEGALSNLTADARRRLIAFTLDKLQAAKA
jgi:DNA-binding IscR family transcriptional regulator